jgi:single-strand DNA-binding protein
VLLTGWRHWLTEIKKLIILNIYIMYALKNKVQLIGNLGKAPEVKTLEGGKKVARFTMATNETYRDRAGRKETQTTWHNIVAWGKVAEIAEKFLDRGKEVAIEGKLVNRSYNDKAGNKQFITEVVANELLLLGDKERA